MSEYSILKLKDKAFDLQNRFIAKFKQTWSLRESVEELNIQIGHLCQSFINNNKLLQSSEAFNQPDRVLVNIKDELCDCFLSVCSIYKFYGMDDTQLCAEQVVPKDYGALMMELFILSEQLLDSCLILQKIKPPLNRDENLIFIRTYSLILGILEQIASMEQIDMEKEFDKMIERTLIYLQGEL